jgi:enoyl-[acyl-carrier protein] reductase/trans-2-enoyl-CoA reductase (NAD+)
MDRLFRDRLYSGKPLSLDDEGRIRIDDFEMGQAVQAEVEARMSRIGPYNMGELADIAGYRSDFLRVNGFDIEGVDYGAEIAPDWDPARA